MSGIELRKATPEDFPHGFPPAQSLWSYNEHGENAAKAVFSEIAGRKSAVAAGFFQHALDVREKMLPFGNHHERKRARKRNRQKAARLFYRRNRKIRRLPRDYP